jgi:hypothetical protein
VELSKTSKVDLLSLLEGSDRPAEVEIEWQDCPFAMRLDSISAPVIALKAELVALLQHLDRRDTQPRLHVLGATAREEIERCEWNQLVLDQRAVSLLRDDF